MRELFDELTVKCNRLRMMEAEAETLRTDLVLRDDAAAKERAVALMAGDDPPKRDKKSDADRQRLAEIDATLPHVRTLVTAAAIEFRNKLAARLNTASKTIGGRLEGMRKEMQLKIVDATAELNALQAGPELRLNTIVMTGSRLMETQSAGEIMTVATDIFADFKDILEPQAEPVEAVAQ